MTDVGGTADADYPVTNLNDRKAHSVCRATGTSLHVRATFAAPVTLEGIHLVHTNATDATLSNGAGLGQALDIASTPLDGLPLDPWKDLRGLANRTSTTWDLTLTGPSGVGLGELVLIQTLRSMPFQWGLSDGNQHRMSLKETDYGVRLKYTMGVRQRVYSGSLFLDSDSMMADLVALQRDARGAFYPFTFVPDLDENDAVYVDLTVDTYAFTRVAPSAGQVSSLQLTEQQKGLAL
jgi:hypothetical protein